MRVAHVGLLGLPLMLAVAHGNEPNSTQSFDALASDLRSRFVIVLAATCRMENGDISTLIFQQNDTGGHFFELDNGKTVRAERVDYIRGGYEIGTGTGDRYMTEDDQVIENLLSMNYFLQYSDSLDLLWKVPPKQKCFENE